MSYIHSPGKAYLFTCDHLGCLEVIECFPPPDHRRLDLAVQQIRMKGWAVPGRAGSRRHFCPEHTPEGISIKRQLAGRRGRGREILTAETFVAHVKVTNGCWLWTEKCDREGYGRWGSKFAHRLSYEIFKGPIPAGFHIDHLCFNPTCVRSQHLQAVEPTVNNRRKLKALAQECSKGHPFTPENTGRQHGGRRRCRTCENDGQRRRYRQRKAAKETDR